MGGGGSVFDRHLDKNISFAVLYVNLTNVCFFRPCPEVECYNAVTVRSEAPLWVVVTLTAQTIIILAVVSSLRFVLVGFSNNASVLFVGILRD